MFVDFYYWIMNVDWNSEAVTAAATVALAVLTLVLAFGTIFLYFATRRLVIGAEDTARRQLRAYVFAVRPEIGDWKDRNLSNLNPLMAKLIIKNTGQTPAYECRVIGGMCIRDYSRDLVGPVSVVELDYNDPGIGKGMLGPGADREKSEPLHVDDPTEHRYGRAPTEDEIAGLQITDALSELPGDQPKTVFVYGEILYRDEFGTDRWTTYCFISNSEVQRYRGVAMAEYKFWNQAGEEGDGQKKPPFCRRVK